MSIQRTRRMYWIIMTAMTASSMVMLSGAFQIMRGTAAVMPITGINNMDRKSVLFLLRYSRGWGGSSMVHDSPARR